MKIRHYLTKLYYSSKLVHSVISPVFKVRNQVISQKTLIEFRFKRMLGYKLDLNNPKSYNEKLQWLKLNDRSDLHIQCADKYAVRTHIELKIGDKYLIPLIKDTQNVEEITPENLPDYPVIIKTNHDSGGITIVWDKNDMDWSKTRKKLAEQLNSTYANHKGEWQYNDIEPRLVVEKLLVTEEGMIPSDFKLHCFNGKVVFTQVDLDRATDHKRNLYDINWNLIPCKWNYENGEPVRKPEVFEKMVEIAEKLAKDFICVRVDLYVIEHKIYFGELTFHSESGFGKFEPQEWDFKFGKMLKLPFEN